MTEVLFLGVGSAIPIPGQTNSAFVLRTDESRVLVDCGPAILQQLAAVSMTPADITHIYITHRHGDHCLGYAMLMLWYVMYASETVHMPTIIASDITFKSLDVLMKSVFGGELAGKTDAAQRIVLPQADSAVQVTPTLHLRALPMRHHEFAPVLGARFEVDGKVVAFTGDTMPNENIITLARDADLLVHDATYCATLNPEYAGGAYGHSTAQDAARHAAQANTRHLALVHIDSMYAGTITALIDEAQRAYTGRVSAPVAGTLFSL